LILWAHATLDKVLQALDGRAQAWPAGARERFNVVRDAAAAGAASTTTPVIFLKNVLIRDPEYRAALAAVTTPQEAIGEPLFRFVALPNPEPQPAAPDDRLTFSVDPTPPVASPGASWAGAVGLTGDGRPTVLALAEPGLDGVAPADLNYDFRTDVVVAGTTGLHILSADRQGHPDLGHGADEVAREHHRRTRPRYLAGGYGYRRRPRSPRGAARRPGRGAAQQR
jgi:hypothetical protein